MSRQRPFVNLSPYFFFWCCSRSSLVMPLSVRVSLPYALSSGPYLALFPFCSLSISLLPLLTLTLPLFLSVSSLSPSLFSFFLSSLVSLFSVSISLSQSLSLCLSHLSQSSSSLSPLSLCLSPFCVSLTFSVSPPSYISRCLSISLFLSLLCLSLPMAPSCINPLFSLPLPRRCLRSRIPIRNHLVANVLALDADLLAEPVVAGNLNHRPSSL